MTHTQRQLETYTKYVSDCIANGQMPLQFDSWHQEQMRQASQLKIILVPRYSEVGKCWHHLSIPATSQFEANKKADQWVADWEYRYKLENGKNGKVLSVAEQEAIEERRFKAKLERVRKQLDKEKKEQAAFLEKMKKRLGIA